MWEAGNEQASSYEGEPAMSKPAPMSGRRAEAARNDSRILQSARAVFIADPQAPITAVAKHAGVGISALYSRYGSKEALLRKLCTDGMVTFLSQTEAALARARAGEDHWEVFTAFMTALTDADATSLTLALAGSFTPTPEMYELAERSGQEIADLFDIIRDTLRPDVVVHDLSLVFELLAAIKLGDADRTHELRRRYLAVILDGLRAGSEDKLPGPPPGWRELTERWNSE
jgi:AcrR family transcriptional regulator